MEVEPRLDEVLNMAANTKTLPMIDMSINGALRIQFTMTMVSLVADVFLFVEFIVCGIICAALTAFFLKLTQIA